MRTAVPETLRDGRGSVQLTAIAQPQGRAQSRFHYLPCSTGHEATLSGFRRLWGVPAWWIKSDAWSPARLEPPRPLRAPSAIPSNRRRLHASMISRASSRKTGIHSFASRSLRIARAAACPKLAARSRGASSARPNATRAWNPRQASRPKRRGAVRSARASASGATAVTGGESCASSDRTASPSSDQAGGLIKVY